MGSIGALWSHGVDTVLIVFHVLSPMFNKGFTNSVYHTFCDVLQKGDKISSCFLLKLCVLTILLKKPTKCEISSQ